MLFAPAWLAGPGVAFFGPLFPIMTYQNLDEVIEYVTARDRPLGFYVFTKSKANKDKLLYNTISGGVTINNCIMHVAQHDLPFGGTGASGMGQYHGWEGFVEFSKMRPIHTNPWFSLLHIFYPPTDDRPGDEVQALRPTTARR